LSIYVKFKKNIWFEVIFCLLISFCRALAKIQALLVFMFGFVFRQKPNVLECAVGISTMRHNVLRLCEEADFGALNCQHTTKVDARQNVQLTTEPAFLQNRC